jgi:hypothetical protein
MRGSGSSRDILKYSEDLNFASNKDMGPNGVVSRSHRPGAWYAGLELTIGSWSLVLMALIPQADRLAGLLTGVDPSMFRHWSVAFRVLPYFEKSTGRLHDFQRLKIHATDARRFVNTCDQPFDVIVADLFHPDRDGAGFRYTVEHFTAIRSLLNPDGVFCQWLPLYQMDLDVLRTIIRTFMQVFPNGNGVLATYICRRRLSV